MQHCHGNMVVETVGEHEHNVMVVAAAGRQCSRLPSSSVRK